MAGDSAAFKHHFYQIEADRNFLWFFVPFTNREVLAVLDTWAVDMERIARNVSSPHLALIKWQWWRDEIAKIYAGNTTVGNPLLEKLSFIIRQYNLPAHEFDNVLTGLSQLVISDPPTEVGDALKKAGVYETHLMHLKMRVIMADKQHETNLWDYAAQRYAVMEYALREKLPRDINRALVKYVEDGKRLTTGHTYARAMDAMAVLRATALIKADCNQSRLKPIPFKELRVWWRAR